MQRVIKLTVLLFLFVFGDSYSQSLNFGRSVVLWGQNPKAGQIDVEYKNLFGTAVFMPTPMSDKKGGITHTFIVGLFYAPDISTQVVTITPMIGVFNKAYPSENGRKLNFGIELSRRVLPSIDLYYRHTSNGYFGKVNPGLDVIGMKLAFSNPS